MKHKSKNINPPKKAPVAVTRRHRQASDAKWRTNMYICFKLLKHSGRRDEFMLNPGGKITRIAALKQALNKIPEHVQLLSRLLEVKNRKTNGKVTLEDTLSEFQTLTDQAERHTRLAKFHRLSNTVNLASQSAQSLLSGGSASSTDQSMSQNLISGRSDSRTSLAGSYISDISCAIDGFTSRPDSCSELDEAVHHLTSPTHPDYTDLSFNAGSDIGLPYSQISQISETQDSNILSDSQLSTNSRIADLNNVHNYALPPTIDQSISSLDLEEYVDLETLIALQKSPWASHDSKNDCKQHCSPYETPKARVRSPRDVLLINESRCRNLDFGTLPLSPEIFGKDEEGCGSSDGCGDSGTAKNLAPDEIFATHTPTKETAGLRLPVRSLQHDSEIVDTSPRVHVQRMSVAPARRDTWSCIFDMPSDAEDEGVEPLSLYDSPRGDGKLLTTKSDPMFSDVDRKCMHSAAAMRCASAAMHANSLPLKEIVSPWKMEDIDLECYQLMFKQEN